MTHSGGEPRFAFQPAATEPVSVPEKWGRRWFLRPVLLLVVVVGVGMVTALAWKIVPRKYTQPVEAAVRDHLSYRQVIRYHEEIWLASEESGVDPYLLSAIMVSESSGRPGAVSSKGAMGLFQLSRTTATWRAESLGLPTPTDEQLLSDPLLNARLGADNVAWLLDTFDGDVVRAMCAYNAGARRMKEIAADEGGWEAWRATHESAGDSDILKHAFKIVRYRDEFRERGLFEEDGRSNPEDGR
jgi:soluble lytic murein transglycosylase-like protein